MSFKSGPERQSFSRLRQSLTRLAEEAAKVTGACFSDKPLLKGSLYELKRKCGKPGCRCAQGKLHCSMAVSNSEKGKTKLNMIPRGYLVEAQIQIRRYQKLRRNRARLIELQREMVDVIDKMEAMRLAKIPTKKGLH